MSVQFDNAAFSPCGLFRYSLTRNWAGTDHDRVCFIMLNPSTADADKDDPTIRSCVRIARNFAGSLCVVNLFAYRATDQRKLLYARDPIGPENNKYIREAVRDSDLVFAAWGVERPLYKPRAAAVRAMLLALGKEIYCLGITKDGYPRHPLFVAGTTAAQVYNLGS